MSIEEKRRELFEAYCVSDAGGYCKEHLERDAEGNYTVVWEYWGVWNAALDAVTILLPSPYPSVFYGAEEFADGIEECREFIKENNPLGLKVKP